MSIKDTKDQANKDSSHLQLLCSLFQQSLSGFTLLDHLTELIHFVVVLLHLSSQLIPLLDHILQLHLSFTSLLLCFGLLLTQQRIALSNSKIINYEDRRKRKMFFSLLEIRE